jgi:glycosyltransferase involved in cell wall biosynthesis
MTAWRDQRTLLLAQHRLRTQGIDTRLVMIGDGPMRPSLEALRRELGLEEVATFRGYQADLCDFFAAIDVYVNPAIAEGFGIAVVEAMLEGIPAILANAGAHPELVTDGVTGLLYPPKDAAQLATLIETLTDDETRAAALGAAGREFAQQSFGSQRYALAYLDAVRRLPPTANASLFAILS